MLILDFPTTDSSGHLEVVWSASLDPS
uniref:Uncharacterized protein n=1 Tax=Lotus japonicus TaxID=34305 RepID=I3SWE9_LOTJA|nr:unknown [Lotus japonicus]